MEGGLEEVENSNKKDGIVGYWNHGEENKKRGRDEISGGLHVSLRW